MQRLIVVLIVATLGWYGYTKYQEDARVRAFVEAWTPRTSARQGAPSPMPQSRTASPFKCDGRTYCSQMTSCAEATFFLKNCPGTKMDGNNDGIPCEKQCCK